MTTRFLLLALASSASLPAIMASVAQADTPTKIVVTGQRRAPNVPTTTEGVTAEALGKAVNVVTPEDTLRYVPNVLIRQRHIGDTQAPITTRTSGVGGSARSLIYVDGILISALIGNNNTSASPKWGLIAPEAVSRVDVLYGPFSAAYAGNSMGSVIEFTTRMPSKLEGTLEVQGGSQAFKKYGDDDSYGTGRIAGSIGDRADRFAWRLSYNHLDTNAQPLTYVTAASAPAGTTGAYADANRTRVPVEVLGSGGLEHQIQDNLSGRLTYDLTPTLTAAYTFGVFKNNDDATVNTYLRDANNAPVYTSAFSKGVYHLDETQIAQALSLTSHTGGVFDYSLTASTFDYQKSHQRTPTAVLPAGFTGGPGTGAWLDGTGWYTLDAKGTWRPNAAHIVTFGAHQDAFKLNNPQYRLSDWIDGAPGTVNSSSAGRTQTQALWVQDALTITPRLKLTSGIRFEHWRAFDGVNYSASPALDVRQPDLQRDAVSPKLVLAYNPTPDWMLKASIGAASRFPTVTELYQTVTTGAVLSVPNPNLRPERAVSSELSAERQWDSGSARVSLFNETIANALISQSAPLVAGSSTLYSYVQNIDRTRATGIELVADQQDVLIKGLQLSGWVTYVDAKIDKDTAYAPAVGKNLPQLPKLRGALVATYSPTPKLDLTLAARYSDRSFGTIDNSDTYANTYTGFSGYFVMDAHVRYKINPHLSAEIGVDNLNNRSYFLYHPFTQRTIIAGLKYSY
ncbi:TonB-dependent receptor [Asticcacaulis sp. EMRT-3]|uniref:TonB-dependent receptor n=1 Tax=Asticcacaulis sp. EMRT-3 TaxID=3040349 RepID=UPI0024AFEDA8|nr:TonB-dependent receptor [Asticcacaulis sp. EMRT-3]MDI7774526.1 TonB-dependent receptor [Asticcacaulis sp. EMRT-3]